MAPLRAACREVVRRLLGRPRARRADYTLGECPTGHFARYRGRLLYRDGPTGIVRTTPAGDNALAVGYGLTCRPMQATPEAGLAAYLHAVASNLVSVAIRCGVVGQRHGLAVLVALETLIVALAAAAAASTLDDLGSATMRAEIASLRHETLPTRLFRS